ncbi:uncharacterized protein LOC144040012 isoform X1 [Vanacampus margaritifer]
MDELLDELLDRSPSSLVSEEPPAFPSVWRSSRLCAHSFFHNKHGLAHGRLFGSPIFHEQKHRPRQDVCAELHFLPRRVEVSRPSERRADGRRLLSALFPLPSSSAVFVLSLAEMASSGRDPAGGAARHREDAAGPFDYASGSGFDEMRAGVGGSRLGNLLKDADAPCVIFMDELDGGGGGLKTCKKEHEKLATPSSGMRLWTAKRSEWFWRKTAGALRSNLKTRAS